MRIGEAPSIRRPIPLTPLIDVVFLLLMFFMLSSTFAKFGTIEAGAARAGTEGSAAAASGAQPFPGVIVVVSGPGDVAVNGSRVARDQLAASLDGLFAKGVRLAALRATKSVSVQDLVSVLDIAKQSRVTDIVVVP